MPTEGSRSKIGLDGVVQLEYFEGSEAFSPTASNYNVHLQRMVADLLVELVLLGRKVAQPSGLKSVSHCD